MPSIHPDMPKLEDPYFSNEPEVLRSLITQAREKAAKWQTKFYEAEASHTEARGMLCQERDAAITRLSDATQRARDYIVEITGGNIGGGDDPVGFLIASHAERVAYAELVTGLLRDGVQWATGDLKLKCLQDEGDRTCMNRCRSEWLDAVKAALATPPSVRGEDGSSVTHAPQPFSSDHENDPASHKSPHSGTSMGRRPFRAPSKPGHKVCSACGVEKPVEAFDRQEGAYLGRNSYCKPCKRQKAKNPVKPGSLEAAGKRLWAKVNKNGPVVKPELGPCWIYTSTSERKGYGVIWFDGKVRFAHRLSWMLAGRTLTDGMVIDHMCSTPKCVHPDHLREVDARTNGTENNVSPIAANAKLEHCPHGHPYSPENTAIFIPKQTKTRHGHVSPSPRPGRMCLTCYPWYWKWAVVPRPKPPRGYSSGGKRRVSDNEISGRTLNAD